MKSQTIRLFIIVLCVSIFAISCKTSKVEKDLIKYEETVEFIEIENSEYMWKTGIITMSPFVNKIGEVMPEYAEHYFLCSEGEYFIKLMDCKNVNAEVKDFKNKYVKMHISIGDGLWDTNDPNVQSRVGSYVIYDSIVEIDEPIKIVYNDGNANAYIISTKSFKYAPVTPMESSSGTYSGGEPKDFEIEQSTFNEIFIRAEKIATTDDIKIDTRQMGTGFIKITFKDSEIKAYIANSSDLTDFQYYLNEIKDYEK